MDTVTRQMRVAACWLEDAVAKELGDHRQRLAESQRTGSEAVAQVVSFAIQRTGARER